MGYADGSEDNDGDDNGGGGESDRESLVARDLRGLHMSSWYELFGTSQEACDRGSLEKVWSKLMLKFHPDQAFRHPWSAECANLALLLISAGRELILEHTPCGARQSSFNK